ncbi:TRIC cation channel family protein [Geminicoccaceae bacterium 1502E]|nr:TRIC cation channel family protein [Geminicoccaceae bacterium 1502E]
MGERWGLRVVLLWVALLTASGAHAAEMVDGHGNRLPVLRGGWTLWNPYQFVQPRQAERVEATVAELYGIDVDITNAVAREAGFAVEYRFRPWQAHLAQLRAGEADIASGATPLLAGPENLVASIPYRSATTVLYVRRDEAAVAGLDSVAALLRTLRTTGFRLGVIGGAAYPDPALNAWLADPPNRARIVPADNDYESFRNLIGGRVDGLLTDRLAGMAASWRGGWERQVTLQDLALSGDVAFLFNGTTVPPGTVDRFDAAIERLQQQGGIERLITRYQLPVLMGRVMDRGWFKAMDIVGTVAFALSGVIIAVRERYSLLGGMVLAALPAVGGGTLRDLLVGREPLGVLASPLYLGLVIGTVLAGFLVVRLVHLAERRCGRPLALRSPARQRARRHLYEVSDAIGLAAFTVTGVAVAISSRTEPLWLWAPLLAMLTGAGGGILRDLVRRADRIDSLHDAFYAEVPLIWGFLLIAVLLLAGPTLDPDLFFMAVLVTIVGAFWTRLAVVFLRIKSPAFA